jgi:hypothetical protein
VEGLAADAQTVSEPAVDAVAGDRMAEVGEVHTDLMRPAGDEHGLDEAVPREGLNDPVARDRRSP